jgi:hypothetical protein
MDRPFIISALILSGLLLGCARSGSELARSAPAKQIEKYADLPGLSSSPHAELKAELALLTQERMTPLALDAQLDAIRSQSGAAPTSGRQMLDEAIPAISRPLLKAQLDEVYRGGPLTLSPIELERARHTLRRWADDRARFEQAVDACHGGLDLRMTHGILAELRFLEVLQLGCKLEALAAAESLAENRPEEAIAPLAVMFRAARVLAGEWNVTTRVSAANLREDALHVLDAIANHDLATSETHQQLLALVTRETNDWPPDATAWIGDRAAGLIAYELVRDGYYFSLLEQDELQHLRDDGLLDATAKAVMRNLDGDQMYYLAAMRRIIESCQLPYFQRAAVLREIRSDLAAREQAADYPLVAGRLLLADFESGHRLVAEDLARCTAWQVALIVATEGAIEEGMISPITGQPLKIQRSPTQWSVAGAVPGQSLHIRLSVRPGSARVADRP